MNKNETIGFEVRGGGKGGGGGGGGGSLRASLGRLFVSTKEFRLLDEPRGGAASR